jgi:hypothetical protein
MNALEWEKAIVVYSPLMELELVILQFSGFFCFAHVVQYVTPNFTRHLCAKAQT